MKHFMIGVRLSDDERQVVEKAAEKEKQLGDRGGLAAWARRALLREAQRILSQEKEK